MKEAKKRRVPIWGKVLIVLATVLIVFACVASLLLYNFALKTESPVYMGNIGMTQFVGESDGETDDAEAIEYSGFVGTPEQRKWFEDASESVNINSADGLKLHAYFIENTGSDKYVITCHGYTSTGAHMAAFSQNFYNMGYNVLAPDARAHGDSEGTVVGMGWPERFDMLKWMDFIIEKNPQAQIVLHGVSMGGATVLMTSGETLPENVKCIVEDCGYTSVWDEFVWQAKSLFNLPSFPLLNMASVISKIDAGYSFKEASALEKVKRSATPTLFIHGTQDVFVPYAMLDELYNAANMEKQRLDVEGAAHGMASSTDPDLYWSTIEEFIAKYVA